MAFFKGFLSTVKPHLMITQEIW